MTWTLLRRCMPMLVVIWLNNNWCRSGWGQFLCKYESFFNKLSNITICQPQCSDLRGICMFCFCYDTFHFVCNWNQLTARHMLPKSTHQRLLHSYMMDFWEDDVDDISIDVCIDGWMDGHTVGWSKRWRWCLKELRPKFTHQCNAWEPSHRRGKEAAVWARPSILLCNIS